MIRPCGTVGLGIYISGGTGFSGVALCPEPGHALETWFVRGNVLQVQNNLQINFCNLIGF